MTVSAAVLRYGVIVEDLLAYQESVGQVAGDTDLAESVRAVASLSRAKIQMAEAQAEAFLALHERGNGDEQVVAFLATQTGVQESLLAFSRVASPSQQDTVNSLLAGGAVVLAEQAANDVVRLVGQSAKVDPQRVVAALGPP